MHPDQLDCAHGEGLAAGPQPARAHAAECLGADACSCVRACVRACVCACVRACMDPQRQLGAAPSVRQSPAYPCEHPSHPQHRAHTHTHAHKNMHLALLAGGASAGSGESASRSVSSSAVPNSSSLAILLTAYLPACLPSCQVGIWAIIFLLGTQGGGVSAHELCASTHACMHANTHTRARTCTHTRARTCTLTLARACICSHTHGCMHARSHACTHSRTHAHMHTPCRHARLFWAGTAVKTAPGRHHAHAHCREPPQRGDHELLCGGRHERFCLCVHLDPWVGATGHVQWWHRRQPKLYGGAPATAAVLQSCSSGLTATYLPASPEPPVLILHCTC